MIIIDQESQLQDVIDDCLQQEFIAVDTEFVRDNLYYPLLCMVQIATQDNIYLIDTISCADISALEKIFANDNIVKIFHSCRSDILILERIYGNFPSNIFDTQIACAILGYGDNIGYASMVRNFLSIELDKSMQYGEWDKRPLSKQQYNYAALDVKYLYKIYSILLRRLKKRKKLSWQAEEMQYVRDKNNYVFDITSYAYKIKKGYSNFSALLAMVEWREGQAKYLDKPRKKIASDDVLASIALQMPTDIAAMDKYDISKANSVKALFKIVEKYREVENSPRLGTTTNQSMIVDVIKIMLKKISKDMRVSSNLIASNQDIENYIIYPAMQHKIMRGWRYDIFGQYIESFTNGLAGLYISENNLEIKS